MTREGPLAGALADRPGEIDFQHSTADRTTRHALARRRWERPTRGERLQLAAIGRAELEAFGGDALALIGSLVERLERVTP